MSSDVSDQKSLMPAIENLMRTVQKIETALTPIAKQQTQIFDIMKEHNDAIDTLMDVLMGTEEINRKRFQQLELSTKISQVKISSLENRLSEQAKLLGDLKQKVSAQIFTPKEVKIIKGIFKRRSKYTATIDDLNFLNNLIAKYESDIFLLNTKTYLLVGLITDQKMTELRKDALEFIDSLVKKYPKEAYYWYMKGRLTKDNNAQLDLYNKAFDYVSPDDYHQKHMISHSKAYALSNTKKFAEALANINQAIEFESECDTAWSLKGSILLNLKQFLDALGCFVKAIEMDSSEAYPWYGKALALSSMGIAASDEAIASLDKAISLDPNNIAYYTLKGNLLTENQRYHDAIEVFNEALTVDEENACLWCEKARIFDLMNDLKNEKESFEKVFSLKLPKGCVAPFNQYAYMLYNHKEYAEGERFAKIALEADPEDPRIIDTYACNLYGLGRDAEALKWFTKAIELKEADDDISWLELATLYQRIGKEKEASEAKEKARLIADQNGKAAPSEPQTRDVSNQK